MDTERVFFLQKHFFYIDFAHYLCNSRGVLFYIYLFNYSPKILVESFRLIYIDHLQTWIKLTQHSNAVKETDFA